MYEVKSWKHEVRQRQETRKEKPVGLHSAFEVFDPTVRSFLAAQSIATPSDLRLTRGAALARCFIKWRVQQGMTTLKFNTSEKLVSTWKESVERQGMGLAGTVAATRPLPEPQETLLSDAKICHDDAAEATTPYAVNNETLGMTPIETTADYASAHGQEQGVCNGITPHSQRKRAQDESTETRHVESSRKKFRYSVFWV
jgi:hypothetical protein